VLHWDRREKCRQAGDASRRHQLRGLRELCIPVEAIAELAFASVRGTEDSALFAALDTVPSQPVSAIPSADHPDVKRDGKILGLVDVATRTPGR